MRLPCSHLLTPNIPQHQYLNIPSFSFLIEHPGLHRKILFDLGLRKDISSHPPAVQSFLSESGWNLQVTKDIPDILKENDITIRDIEAVIFSHHHFDHIGDLSQFPQTTDVVVGPGFKEAYLPGWPENPQASLINDEWKIHNIREISFENGSKTLLIGGFPAIDYFGDGSFFLLDAPGHTVGHIAALARVTTASTSSGECDKDTFVLIGGDICHYPGVFRPTKSLPLDTEVQATLHACPVSLFLDVHPEKSHDRPYYNMPVEATVDKESADLSIQRLSAFDANADVMVIIGHDASLVDKLQFFPKTINAWKQEKLKNYRWEFLRDFCNKS